MASLKSLNKLPNTRVFLAAEKWMVRSTGVGGLFSSKQEPATIKTLDSFSVDAIFCFVKICFQKSETNTT